MHWILDKHKKRREAKHVGQSWENSWLNQNTIVLPGGVIQGVIQSDDVVVLRIVLKVQVVHKLLILKQRNPSVDHPHFHLNRAEGCVVVPARAIKSQSVRVFLFHSETNKNTYLNEMKLTSVGSVNSTSI